MYFENYRIKKHCDRFLKFGTNFCQLTLKLLLGTAATIIDLKSFEIKNVKS